jgi:hypothetical protein
VLASISKGWQRWRASARDGVGGVRWCGTAVRMVCVGEGRLLDGVRWFGTAVWMVCVGEGRLLDGVRRLGTAF